MQGRLVCPRTRKTLRCQADQLVTPDGEMTYPVPGGVPILLADPSRLERYRQEQGGAMHAEYLAPPTAGAFRRWANRLLRDGPVPRSEGAERAFAAVVAERGPGDLVLSIGGGPGRPHPALVNLNVDLFPGVDVVGDAYELPYADGSVDAIHCEAVLEHLERPDLAVAEMVRVLRPGGEAFAATPFLQAFHAYPNHFQNFTSEGHRRLFARAGFEVLAAGACVGPTFALTDLAALYLRSYLPTRTLSRLGWAAALLMARLLRPLDRRLLRDPEAHVLASLVYAHLRKP
ncbi:MAG TPA: methyltransferase domain-containing protein [Thermoanaerobaculia bacterium]|nr:methyltransferase domain-containing protein [Thermoanaerobaculia bacterium]